MTWCFFFRLCFFLRFFLRGWLSVYVLFLVLARQADGHSTLIQVYTNTPAAAALLCGECCSLCARRHQWLEAAISATLALNGNVISFPIFIAFSYFALATQESMTSNLLQAAERIALSVLLVRITDVTTAPTQPHAQDTQAQHTHPCLVESGLIFLISCPFLCLSSLCFTFHIFLTRVRSPRSTITKRHEGDRYHSGVSRGWPIATAAWPQDPAILVGYQSRIRSMVAHTCAGWAFLFSR